MFKLTLRSKEDVNNLKNKLRSACDEQGVRLGNSQQKVEAILAHTLGFRDFNTLLGVANKPDDEAQVGLANVKFNQWVSMIERVNVPSTTYGALDKIRQGLRNSKGIKLIIFAARDGDMNESATTVLVVAESGTLLYDRPLLTVERRPRELEVIDLFNEISTLGLLSATRYVPHRLEPTSELPTDEVAKMIVDSALEPVFPDWRGFLAMYNKEMKRYSSGIYADEYWDKLKDSLRLNDL